ncbi:MAG: hypoxanthine phosphoribosyltransferase [Candidatus Nanopelagicales bacterium]|nr:hypoxanthine phosphoribosyltransferase [Candidatus Nanopelagicales bacterium]
MNCEDLAEDLDYVLFTEEQVQARVAELAAQVDQDYAGEPLLLIGVLKGAMMVMADLSRAMTNPAEIDWMAISSYGAAGHSSGVVRILKDLDTDIAGRHVLIVEDVLDSGLTLRWLLRSLHARQPASIQLLTLLRKPEAVRNEVNVRYVGFEIDDHFVVGYGMDLAEKYRNLRCIGVLHPNLLP